MSTRQRAHSRAPCVEHTLAARGHGRWPADTRGARPLLLLLLQAHHTRLLHAHMQQHGLLSLAPSCHAYSAVIVLEALGEVVEPRSQEPGRHPQLLPRCCRPAKCAML
jgi:hypothetical protein